jgi:cytochrome P450
VPAQDQPQFRAWAEVLFNQQTVDATTIVNEELINAIAPTVREMNEYLLAHIRRRRQQPTSDLIGKLTTAEVDGERLADEEIVGFAGILLLAGHITTTALLGNAVLCFDRHPEAAAAVRADRALLPAAIEEVLRYRSPFPKLVRVATTDTEIGGHAVPAGQLVSPWIAAANRDPARFPEPDRFDIHRNSTVTWHSGMESTSVSAPAGPAGSQDRLGDPAGALPRHRSGRRRIGRVPQPVDDDLREATAGARRYARGIKLCSRDEN